MICYRSTQYLFSLSRKVQFNGLATLAVVGETVINHLLFCLRCRSVNQRSLQSQFSRKKGQLAALVKTLGRWPASSSLRFGFSNAVTFVLTDRKYQQQMPIIISKLFLRVSPVKVLIITKIIRWSPSTTNLNRLLATTSRKLPAVWITEICVRLVVGVCF